MNLLPWIGGAGTLIGILALFVKIAARWFARKIDSLKESVNVKVDGAVQTIRAETAAKVDGAMREIKAETAARIDGLEKTVQAIVSGAVQTIRAETVAKIDGAVQTIRAETAAKIDGAVREIKAYVDGAIKAFKAEARGERKVQDKEMEHLKCATEENKRDIRNLESVVYRDGMGDEDGGGENPDAPKSPG